MFVMKYNKRLIKKGYILHNRFLVQDFFYNFAVQKYNIYLNNQLIIFFLFFLTCKEMG